MLSIFLKLFNRKLFILIGWLLIFLSIWFLGPLFSFADWRPLASIKVRIIIISGILVFFLIRMIARFLISRKLNQKIIDAAIGMQKNSSQDDNASLITLKAGFENAINKLKTTKYSSHNSSIWSRFNKKYIYELPWYVFIGAPGSGKTTALMNSGLNFPLLNDLGESSIKGVGGTRNCDWWFSDETVLLDTAGRYTTHESNKQADKEEWQGFLALLKKFRPKQPLNGVLLTISTLQVLNSSEKDLKEHATSIRARISELYHELETPLPIYILVTKADLIGGFNEFYSNLSSEQRKQVWGFTFKHNEASSQPVLSQLPTELAKLEALLFDHQVELIRNEPDSVRRTLIYAFPQNFSLVSHKLNSFLKMVFNSSSYGDEAMIRGVYFTSGTQEGTPVDRVLGALSRSLGKDRPIAIGANKSSGRSYFLENLLRLVIFKESHLVGYNHKKELRSRIFSIAGHTLVFFIFLSAISFLAISFINNKGYIDLVEEKTKIAAEHIESIHSDSDLLDLLPFLNYLEKIADGAGFPAVNPPLKYRYGLYQGNKLQSISQVTYTDALHKTLLPNISKRIETILSNSYNHDFDLSYEALKAYLMLQNSKHYNSEFLSQFIYLDLSRSLPAHVTKEQFEELSNHLSNLFTVRPVLLPFKANEELIKKVRSNLQSYSLAQRSYNRLKLNLLDSTVPDFNLMDAGGPHASRVFTRKSGRPIAEGIPFLYTHDGYHKQFLPELTRMVARLEQEDEWVLGRPAQTSEQSLSDTLEQLSFYDVKRLYLHDYVRIWDDYLADIAILDSRSLHESIEHARILSAPDSPLLQFTRGVAKETQLTKSSSEGNDYSLKSRTISTIKGASNDLERVFGSTPLTRHSNKQHLESIVDDRFEPLRRLAGNNSDNQAPIHSLIKLYNDMYMSLTSLEAGLQQGGLRNSSDNTNHRETLRRIKSEAAHLPAPFRTMLEDLADTSTSQATGSLRRSLAGELDQSVGQFCRQAIQGRYPFNQASNKDVTASDFGKLFSHRGLFQQFFDQHLVHSADLSGATWVLRQPGGSLLSLASFQQAARIREVFFPNASNAPELEFKLQVLEMDASISQISFDFDGQSYHYAHGPQLPKHIKWPGPRGSDQVRVEILQNNKPAGILVTNGPWAPIRLLDHGKLSNSGSRERVVSALNIDGRRVVIEILASSVQNPFSLREIRNFSCPQSL